MGPMALAPGRISFYSISMKNKIMSILTLAACITISIPGYAQKGKIVKQVIAGSAPQQAAVQTAQTAAKTISAQSRATALLSAVNKAVPIPAPEEAVQAQPKSLPMLKDLRDNNAYMRDIGTVMNLTEAKKTLNFAFAMERERANARRLAATMQNYQTLNLSDVQESALLDKISGFVVNHSLQNYLLDSMVNKNYMQFLRDLSNYYSLSVKFMTSYELRFISSQDVKEVFAQTALDYMKAHPHKMNLKLREIMKSPFVNENLKSTLRSFIALRQVLPQHESGFLTVLREAYKQYSNGLAAARTQEDVTQTVAIYQKTLKELEAFVKRYNRSPRWNAQLPERRLYNKLLLLITHNQANQFKQVAPYITQIQQILTQYPRIRFTAEETMSKLQAFIAKNHRLPRSMGESPAGVHIPEAELDLYEATFYWERMDKKFASELFDIKRKIK